MKKKISNITNLELRYMHGTVLTEYFKNAAELMFYVLDSWPFFPVKIIF